MDEILNKIRVSKEKETIVEYEKTINKALDYLVSIEGANDERIDEIRDFISRLVDEEIDFLVRNPEDYFHS
tara:strand:+ start:12367 stop:12579 length:213 start_codon:yes stop_codon:yes gene_type:complete